MSKCSHVGITQTGSSVKNKQTYRAWVCKSCGKTWNVKRPGDTSTWKWPD